MKMNSTTTILIASAVVVAALIGLAVWNNVKPSKYDDFAQCLSDQGVTEYAAYWCSACAKQEEILGNASRYINRVECSSPGSHSFDLCPDITSTPTWEGPDGERITGVQSIEQLAERFGCADALPE